MMRKFVWTAVLVAAAAAACGQVAISANHVVDTLMRPIVSAKLCFASVDAAQMPVGFRMGTTQVVPGEVCLAVTRGVMEPGHSLASSPEGTYYHLYLKTAFTNAILRDYGMTPITGTSWTFDTYDPNTLITYQGSGGASITLTTAGNNCATPTYANGTLNIPPCTLVGGTTDWSTLTGKPTFATVSTSGSYLDLLNRPSFATVATSGNYTDLVNKPTVPSAQVQSDWSASSGVASIMNKPVFATVATSGSYADLLNKPTFQAPVSLTTTGDNCAAPTFAAGVLNIPVCAPSGGTTDWTSITGKPSFATVSTTGSYSDLSNKPAIPAAQVQSDWNALSGVAVILNKPNLSVVASSGSYTDLSSKPTLGTAAAQNTSFFDAAGAAAARAAVQSCTNKVLGAIDTAGTAANCVNIDYSGTVITNKPAIPAASSSTPVMDGAGAAGTGAAFARADHVHPTDTTREAAFNAAGVLYGNGAGAPTAATADQVRTALASDATAAARAALPSGAHGVAFDESATAGVPAAGIDYIRADATTHKLVYSINNGAETAIGSGSSAWGGITGTLASQTDLQAALNLKAPLASPTFTGTATAPVFTSNGAPNGYLNLTYTGTAATAPGTNTVQVAVGGAVATPFTIQLPSAVPATGNTYLSCAVPSSGISVCTWAAGGSPMTYPGAGLAVSTGTAWGTSKAAPTGALVGDSDTQSLTNKTVDGVAPATMAYLDATSSVQTQLNAKSPLASPTFTGTATSPLFASSGATNGYLNLTYTGTAATAPGTNTVQVAVGGAVATPFTIQLPSAVPATGNTYLSCAVPSSGVSVCTWAAGGSPMVYPGAGIPVSTGSAWGTAKAAPTGALVGDSDTQALTNKTVDGVAPATMAYLDATSSVQTQLNAKSPLASPTFTGTVTLPGGSDNGTTLAYTGASGITTPAIATNAATAGYVNLAAGTAPTAPGTSVIQFVAPTTATAYKRTWANAAPGATSFPSYTTAGVEAWVPQAGAGAGVTTGPASSTVLNNLVTFADTAGTIKDSGATITNIATNPKTTTAAMTAQSSATCTNITNMSWTLAASKNYLLKCDVPVTFAASATLAFCLAGPGTPTSYSLEQYGPLAASAAYSDTGTYAQSSWGTKTTASGVPGAATVTAHVFAQIQNGSTASGTALTLQTAANGTNNITVGANAACTLTQTN